MTAQPSTPTGPVVHRSEVPVDFERPGLVPRLGLIALSTDLTAEGDAWRALPPEAVRLHVSRVAYRNPTTPENLRAMAPRLAAAADLLVPEVPLAAIYYACTSASVVIGDAEIRTAISTARPGVPVVTPPDAAVAAFAALGVERIALLTPYLAETTRPMAEYFTARGLDVVKAHCLDLADDRDMARITAATIIAAAEAADAPEVEGLFLSCTALPALGVLETLEARLGKPVISSNQASYWRLLGHAGVPAARTAPGRLFTVCPAGAPRDAASVPF